jgi:hypothetical protein
MSDKTKDPAAESPPPGSDEAIKLGCTCAVLDNAHGKGYMSIPGIYVFSEGCPLHWPGEGGKSDRRG